MKTKLLLFIIIIIYTLPACVKEFQPKTNNYDELLVVDGSITNEKGPYTVTLSKSTKITQFSNLKPYSKCKVEIIDNVGNKEELKETIAGIYKTDSLNGIQGIVGRKYKIKITTSEGELYESTEQEIKKPVGIQSVYEEVQHKTDSKLFYGRDGCQFYVDTEIAENDTNYYFWKMESTFKFRTDFPWLDGANKFCYRTKNIKKFFILEQTGAKNQVLHFLLNYEDNYTKALAIRYSLHVTQYNIDELAYKYWNAVKKITGSQGELYTQQPYQIKNNIKNLTNPEKPALGYFMAVGVSEKRIFINRPPIVFRYPRCPLGPDTVEVTPKEAPWEPDCLDCTESGTPQKPDYWID